MILDIKSFDDSDDYKAMVKIDLDKSYTLYKYHQIWLYQNNIKWKYGRIDGLVYRSYILFKNREDATAFRLRFGV